VAKHARVAHAVGAYEELAGAPVVLPTLPAEPIFAYRTRAKLIARAGVGVGLYARGGHAFVELPDCGVLAPEVAALVATLRAWVIAGLPIEGLDVATAGDALLVTLIAGAETEHAAHWVSSRLDALPGNVHVALSVRDGGPQLLGKGHRVLRGRAEVPLRIEPDGAYGYLTHGGFLQAHAGVARALYTRLAAAVEAGRRPRVLELYAGAGSLSLALAASGCDVTAVEAFAPAMALLSRAAREQRLAVRCIAGDAGQASLDLAAQGEAFEVVLVNPPRRGLDARVRRAIAALGARRIAYVSCAPETLARDLAALAHAGYRALEVQPFDMIPMTDHVESMVLLERGELPAFPLVARRSGGTVVLRPPHCDDGEFEARVSAQLGNHVSVRAGASAGLSGLVWVVGEGGRAAYAPETELTLLARGIVHKRGKLGPLRYACATRVGGHSLVRVRGPASSAPELFARFAKIGHPVVGDVRNDRATAKHFAMRHGLDRPFAHVHSLRLARDGMEEERIDTPLWPDLQAVLQSLETDGDSSLLRP
jgi:23S rRNA (uracil1939-C5)-methyltransferase